MLGAALAGVEPAGVFNGQISFFQTWTVTQRIEISRL